MWIYIIIDAHVDILILITYRVHMLLLLVDMHICHDILYALNIMQWTHYYLHMLSPSILLDIKTPEEWEKKIQMLKNYPAKFPSMENHLFSRLAFSYDNLPDEAIKSCFLYCSLFPKDYRISPRHLIQHWIGKGFLDEYDNIQEARNQGEEIIKSLQHACLLESAIS